MKDFTMADLLRIMRECAGEDEAVDLGGDVGETDFADLGYDSLAILETAAAIGREFGVALPEEDIAGVRRPAEFVALVAARRAGTA
ncbi:acyl carrier protein [Saccharothrix australiensis]|uniref:Act minimal PKS acyl carrier protein n=1 Tax=Saccharothrix australiensis TaxID=2072 RepID=A0A495W1W3_9PSEU|nr:acyl carrier protein [Saccharothrix australiensis]RKT55616.1 act minimal PKS acyl carrier protein [Saccharothrix australiensis]